MHAKYINRIFYDDEYDRVKVSLNLEGGIHLLFLKALVLCLVIAALSACEKPMGTASSWKEVSSQQSARTGLEGRGIFVHVVPASELIGCFYVTDTNTNIRTCYPAEQFKHGEYAGLGLSVGLAKPGEYQFSHNFVLLDSTFTPLVSFVEEANKRDLRRYFILCLLLSGAILGTILYNSLVMLQGRYWAKLPSSIMGLCLLFHSLFLYQLFPKDFITACYPSFTLLSLLTIPACLLMLDVFKVKGYRWLLLMGTVLLVVFILASYLAIQYMYLAMYCLLLSSVLGQFLRSSSPSNKIAWLLLAATFLIKITLIILSVHPYFHIVSEALLFISILFLAISQVNAVNNIYLKEGRIVEQHQQQVSLISVVSHELRNSAQILASLVERSGNTSYKEETSKLINLLENVLDTVYFKNQGAPLCKRYIQLDHLTGWRELFDQVSIQLDWDENFVPMFEVNDRVLNRWLIVLSQQFEGDLKIIASIDQTELTLNCKAIKVDQYSEGTEKSLLMQLNLLLARLLDTSIVKLECGTSYKIPIDNLAWHEVFEKKQLKKCKILLVEDEVITRGMLKQWLEAAGHNVIECGDGSQVLGTINKFKPDVLLLDNQLPNMTGVEILEKLKRQSKLQLGVVLISADLPESLPSDVRVLQKPLDEVSLISVIDQVLDDKGGSFGAKPLVNGLDISQQQKILLKLLPVMIDDSNTLMAQIEEPNYEGAANTVHKLIGRLAMIGLNQYGARLKNMEDRLRSPISENVTGTFEASALMSDILASCKKLNSGGEDV